MGGGYDLLEPCTEAVCRVIASLLASLVAYEEEWPVYPAGVLETAMWRDVLRTVAQASHPQLLSSPPWLLLWSSQQTRAGLWDSRPTLGLLMGQHHGAECLCPSASSCLDPPS